jgi:biopolymer transport protein ExbB
MKKSNSLGGIVTVGIIVLEIAIAIAFYNLVLGDPSNFQGNDNANHPLEGNWFGIIYKGGVIVPILIANLMITITFGIERFISITKASGKGNVKNFVLKVKSLISAGNISQAIVECDKQKGSVANVVKAGLIKFNTLVKDNTLEADKKIALIQKDIEETTQLEMPMLEKNLMIIATIVSVATLLGLLGTVMGMIKAFAALATAGAPDSVGLANGISEALINTALGIGTSALAIIFYNYFTSAIDSLTHAIDETSFSIIQNFTAQNKS